MVLFILNYCLAIFLVINFIFYCFSQVHVTLFSSNIFHSFIHVSYLMVLFMLHCFPATFCMLLFILHCFSGNISHGSVHVTLFFQQHFLCFCSCYTVFPSNISHPSVHVTLFFRQQFSWFFSCYLLFSNNSHGPVHVILFSSNISHVTLFL